MDAGEEEEEGCWPDAEGKVLPPPSNVITLLQATQAPPLMLAFLRSLADFSGEPPEERMVMQFPSTSILASKVFRQSKPSSKSMPLSSPAEEQPEEVACEC